MNPTLRKDENALASSMIAFLVAGSLFIGSIAAVLLTTREAASGAAASTVQQSILQVQARSLSQILLESPGHTESGADWASQGDGTGTLSLAEQVTRVGLRDGGGDRVSMNFSKFQNLRLAPLATNVDGYVNYPEARAGLGLDSSGLDFHIRAYPSLPDVADMLKKGYKDPNLRILYLGDYTKQGGGNVPPYAMGLVDQGDRVNVYVNVNNNAATTTAFDALFELELKSSKVSFTLHTGVLAPGQSGNMSFTLLKTADWEWKNTPAKKVNVEIHDKDTKLVDAAISFSAVTMTHASTRPNVISEAEKLTTTLDGGVDARYYYQAFNGRGDPVIFKDWTFRLYDGAGNLLQADVLPDAKEGNVVRSFTGAGTYVAQLWNDALTAPWNSDRVNIVVSEPGPYGGAASTHAPAASVLPEIRLLDELVERFDANAFSSTYTHPDVPHAAGGDVYPDIKDAMNDDLSLVLRDAAGKATLQHYTTLVVGSNVDHNAMTSQAAKGTIHDRVLAGGTLIVFGSESQNVNWLQPLFHSAIQSSSGGLATPDIAHPLLNTADPLDHLNYDNHGRAWTFNGQAGDNAGDHFTNVVVLGSDPVLAESNPGTIGNGTAILTTWTPYDLYGASESGEAERQEGLRLVNNLLMQAYRDLFLDYGPPLPSGANVEPAISRVHIQHPQFQESILLNVAVYVFTGA